MCPLNTRFVRYFAVVLLVGCSEQGPTVLLGDSIMAAIKSDAINLAVSGATLAEICKQARNVPASARLVVVEGGINDIRNGRGAQVIAYYTVILATIPGNASVRMLGVLPVEEGKLAPEWLSVTTNEKISELNRRIFALCRARPNCLPHPVSPFETTDGIHPTARAIEEVRKEIIPVGLVQPRP